MPIAPPRYPGLRAGQLRSLVKIQARVDSTDASGGIQTQWNDVPNGIVWANVTPLVLNRGGELTSAEELRAVKRFKVTMRYRTDITEEHRLLQVNREDNSADRPLNILSVNDPDSRRRQLLLICESGLTSG